MTNITGSTTVSSGNTSTEEHEDGTATAVYYVNSREGRVNRHGEDLTGSVILSRVGLTADKYELFTVVHGKSGPEIKPDQTHHVTPGEHFRATIRGTDFSW